MFPHTITIFNVVKTIDNIIYNKQVVSDVFYYSDKAISQEGNGEKYTTVHHVIFSNEALNNYLIEDYKNACDKENYYTLNVNDIIVVGECDLISDLSDLQKTNKEYFLIKSISNNQYGIQDLQNIEVTN